jgi:hypothetical protein
MSMSRRSAFLSSSARAPRRLAATALLAATAALLAAAPAQAADVSIGVNDSAIDLGYTSPPSGQGLEFTAGWLHEGESRRRGDVLSMGLQLAQEIDPGVRAALGAKALGAFNDTHDAVGLALGGWVDLSPRAMPRLHLGLHGWFAPGVTSFGASSGWRDLGAWIGYEVIPQAQIVLSYRSVHIDYDRSNATASQHAGFIGMKLSF